MQACKLRNRATSAIFACFPAPTWHRKALRLFFILLLAYLPHAASADDLRVFAAASLKDVLDQVIAEFSNTTGANATLVVAGTATLARQISHGAPADIFIAANPQWMDQLEQGGDIKHGTRFNLAGNRLSLIQHGRQNPTQTFKLDDLAAAVTDERLAVAMVSAVPAGIYAKASLQSLGLWSTVNRHLVQTDNVRAALHLVNLGETRYGIVYHTDTLSAELNISVLQQLPSHSHPAITYPAAQVASSAHPQALRFLNFLKSPPAQTLLTTHGFLLPGQPG